MKVDLIMFEDFAYDMYEAFVIRHDPRYPMCFHSIFAVRKKNKMYLNVSFFNKKKKVRLT